MKNSKFILLSALGLVAYATNASAAEPDLKSKKVQSILCARMQKEIPSDLGTKVTIKACRDDGSFTILEDLKDRWIVEYQNSSLVEDMAVVCEVEWAKDKKNIRKLKKAECDLQ